MLVSRDKKWDYAIGMIKVDGLEPTPEMKELTRPRQHRHLKRKDSIRFLVLLVFSNFYIYTGCRKGTRSRQPHPRKDLFKSS